MHNDPFITMWSICADARTKAAKYYQNMLNLSSPVANDTDGRRNNLATSNETKARTYFELTPDLSVHEMYGYRVVIPEYQRFSWGFS